MPELFAQHFFLRRLFLFQELLGFAEHPHRVVRFEARAVGDEAVLFGRQGQAEITLTELAALAGTINYELACAISPRVPRVYVE